MNLDILNAKTAAIGGTVTTVAGVFVIMAYMYTKMIQPEALDPQVYEKRVESQLQNVNSQIITIKEKRSNIENIFSVIRSQLTSSLNEAEPVITENSIKAYFKNDIDRTVRALKLKETEPAVTEPASASSVTEEKDKDLELESGDFFSYLKSDKTLERERTNGRSSKTVQDKVVIKQVGLSLRSKTIDAAVYQVENVFTRPGNVANLFLMKPVSASGSIEFDPFTINFASKDEFLSHFRTRKQSSFEYEEGLVTWTYDFITISFDGKMKELSPEIKTAITPEFIEQVDEINPYKWLHLATLIDSKIQLENPLIVLLYRKNPNPETDHKISYPADINLFDKKTMVVSDKSLFTGCTKRIINHCRDFLSPSENIVI